MRHNEARCTGAQQKWNGAHRSPQEKQDVSLRSTGAPNVRVHVPTDVRRHLNVRAARLDFKLVGELLLVEALRQPNVGLLPSRSVVDRASIGAMANVAETLERGSHLAPSVDATGT